MSLDISHEAIISADSGLSADSSAARRFARNNLYADFAAQASDFGGRFASLAPNIAAMLQYELSQILKSGASTLK